MTRGRVFCDEKIIALVNERFVALDINLVKQGWPTAIRGLQSSKKDFDKFMASPYRQGYTLSYVVSSDGQKILGTTQNALLWNVEVSDAYHPRAYEKLLRKGLSRNARWHRANRLSGYARAVARRDLLQEIAKEVYAAGQAKRPPWAGYGTDAALRKPYRETSK